MRGYAVIHQEKKLKMEPVGGASAFNALANFATEMKKGDELTWDMVVEGYEQWKTDHENQSMDQYIAEIGVTERDFEQGRVLQFHGECFVMEENDLDQANEVLKKYYPKAEIVEIVLFGKSKRK